MLLDPDGVLDPHTVAAVEEECEVLRVRDWVGLRCVWDLDIRHRARGSHSLVLSTCAEFATAADLPWDIEKEATEVIRLRWPVPVELRGLLRAADSAAAESLVGAAVARADVADIVTSVHGIEFGDAASELDGVVRLRLAPETPEELWDVLAGLLTNSAASSVAAGRGDVTGLQQIWNDWLLQGRAEGADALAAAPGAVLALLGAGLIEPAPCRAIGLPDWVQVGAADPEPEQLISELLAARPPRATDLAGWIAAASWWGQVRAALAASPTNPTNAESAWATWEELDSRFRPWLRESYGSSLLSTVPFATVHRIAPGLARRVDEGARVLLIVIDGLGFAQWHPLRRVAGLRIHDSTGSLAMIPTLTSVSRQAIFAGELPRDFADSIRTTSAEEKLWRRFWAEHGVADRDISYTKTLGGDADRIPEPAGRVAGVVVNAVDDILHGAEVLGDRQVAVGVDLWARTGFLADLVSEATGAGFETWITSDHGNLPTVPDRVPREGMTVEHTGLRVRIYPNAALREQAADHGDIWDPPGLPTEETGYYPAFASGRAGYHTGAERVGHGGISLDEVIVPVARVSV